MGVGYRFPSRWDVTWNYTYFHTAGQAADASTPGRQVLIPGPADANFPVGSASATSSFNYNVHDFEIGRWVSLSDAIDVRFFGSFRWAKIESDFDVSYSAVGGMLCNNGIAGTKSEMDAYGIRLGTEYRWWLGATHLSLIGRAAGSVLAGDFRTELTTSDFAGDDDVFIKERRDMQAVPVLDVAAGMAWQRDCWEVSAGYELAAWFNQSATPGLFYGDPNSYGTILLDGLFARVGYKY